MENAGYDALQPDELLIDVDTGVGANNAEGCEVADVSTTALVEDGAELIADHLPTAVAVGRTGIGLVTDELAEPTKPEERITVPRPTLPSQPPIPHSHIPKQCTCKWAPVGNGLWEHTDKTFPGLPECRIDHQLVALQHLSVTELRALARDLGLSSTTRLERRDELALAIAKATRLS
jgi:hypothetical protein